MKPRNSFTGAEGAQGSSAAIGLAGENRVYFASIEQGRSSASRGGIGAVMGDKNVKAVVVRGTRDINVARPLEYLELCNEVLEYIKWRNEHPVPGVMAILTGLVVAPGDEGA